MSISIFGINHKTAPVDIREKVAFPADRINAVLNNAKLTVGLNEVAIISTCNRTEVIYYADVGSSEPLDSSRSEGHRLKFQQIVEWVAAESGLSNHEVEPFVYHHQDKTAIEHTMKVACGLDSMVLGEPQILGQVKDAYAYANQAGTIGFYLNRLFQQTFSLAKRVRTETQIGASAVSVAYAGVVLAKRIFSDFSSIKVLFIGAGETIELSARHLAAQGVTQMNVANRTIERAQGLVDEFGAVAYGLSSLPELVVDADIIVSSTASQLPIIGKGLIEKAIKQRKYRRIFILDLAVPRDVEPEVSGLSDVYLYTIDDMQDVVKENLKQREDAAKEAETIIQQHVEKYLAWLKSLSSLELLKSFREKFQQIKQDELERAYAKLKANEEPEKVMDEITSRLINKFMHSPSKIIRQIGEDNEQEKLAFLAEIFNLNKKDN